MAEKNTMDTSSSTVSENEGVGIVELDPDPFMLESLTAMGMNEHLSKKALIAVKNSSIDCALQWVAELGAEEMEALSHNKSGNSSGSGEWEDYDEEIDFKMVFVVNTEYKMGTGKIASQVGHATLGLYKLLMKDKEKYLNSVQDWEDTGEKKITLKAPNTQELMKIRDSAKSIDLPTYLVEDAGRTQIPSGAVTVLSVFGDEETVDRATGHLKLL